MEANIKDKNNGLVVLLEALATFLLLNMIKIIGMVFKCAPSSQQKHKTYHSMHNLSNVCLGEFHGYHRISSSHHRKR